MKIKTVPLSELYSDPRNARIHNSRNIHAIMDSLSEFDQYAPLVIQASTNRILVGNGRYEAMRKLGWTEAQVVEIDCDERTATRLAIADNRIPELAAWDNKILSELLSEVAQDENVPGWVNEEVQRIMASHAPFAEDDPEEYDRGGYPNSSESNGDRDSQPQGQAMSAWNNDPFGTYKDKVEFIFGDVRVMVDVEVYESFMDNLPMENVRGYLEDLLSREVDMSESEEEAEDMFNGMEFSEDEEEMEYSKEVEDSDGEDKEDA